jgi:hypothetical protein
MVTQADQISALQQQVTELLAESNSLKAQVTVLNNANATAVAQNVTPTTVFEENPYAGNINPSTSSGLKLFTTATAKRDKDDKLSATIAKNQQFLEGFRDDATTFGWSMLTASVGANNHNILNDFQNVNLEKVRLMMNPIFLDKDVTNVTLPGDILPHMFNIDPANEPTDVPIFYSRVRAHMIGCRILNSLDKPSLSSLKLHEHKYLWKSASGKTFYDGPTMLQLLIDTAKPSLRTGVATLKQKLRGSKLATFDNNVKKMTDKMQGTYNEIIRHGQTHEDFIHDLFNALLTSTNETFLNWVTRIQDNYETGTDVVPSTLIKDAVTKYNNMVEKGKWKSGESKDAKLVALTTQLDDLKKRFNKEGKKTGGGGGKSTNDSDDFATKYKIDKWRLSKSFGVSTERDGKTWHWCSKHNSNKGLYVTHKEEDHGKRNQMNSNPGTSSSGSSSSKPDAKKLTLSDNLKAAMCSKFKCSAEDAAQLWCEVASNSKDF